MLCCKWACVRSRSQGCGLLRLPTHVTHLLPQHRMARLMATWRATSCAHSAPNSEFILFLDHLAIPNCSNSPLPNAPRVNWTPSSNRFHQPFSSSINNKSFLSFLVAHTHPEFFMSQGPCVSAWLNFFAPPSKSSSTLVLHPFLCLATSTSFSCSDESIIEPCPPHQSGWRHNRLANAEWATSVPAALTHRNMPHQSLPAGPMGVAYELLQEGCQTGDDVESLQLFFRIHHGTKPLPI